MKLRSAVPGLATAQVRHFLSGMPGPGSYDVVIKPLRYRTHPHLAAWTSFEDRRIVLQLPEPFYAFDEVVPYGAKRLPGKGMRFRWLTETVTFSTPRQVLRFLYLHEWMHWYLREQLGKKAQAETACDRFALRNYRRRTITSVDADAALRRST
jgi:hypothetical protein